MNYPKVVGFVPTYNSEKFLEKTLLALAAIEYPNFKIIIGDDCSTDKTVEIAQAFSSKDSRFEVLTNDKNLGWLKNSEKLWKLSAESSDFCFTNPHDDHPYPNYISKQIEALLQNPEAVVCCPQMKNSYWDGKITYSKISNFGHSEKLEERISEILQRKTMFWWAAYHGLQRSSTVKKILPMRETPLVHKEFTKDLIWLMKMAFYGPFVTIEDCLLEKNYYENSVSHKWKHSPIKRLGLWAGIFHEITTADLPSQTKSTLTKIVFKELIGKGKRRLNFQLNK
ncbi:glycosyltransferase family 2 protein [Algoriphagus limi]|uniref:Glycosyltransferase n=1 Tax=Algoriphagus limi TaxID=2975273 RepID=A0ABT2G7J8_9BACT|nr:glycosyltransferase family 2 protein [Algoriphagus limi]MCS5491174.1 glycosyltransferase [Algoriphagus limi]